MAKTKESIARNVEVRRLLAEGKAPAEVAKLMGVTIEAVYSVRAYDRSKAQKARATPAATGAPRKLGRPKGSKNKQAPVKKAEALIVLPKGKFLQLQQEIETLTERVGTVVAENVALRKEIQTLPKVIEVSVPQPFSHYTFLQRLRILFLGRAA